MKTSAPIWREKREEAIPSVDSDTELASISLTLLPNGEGANGKDQPGTSVYLRKVAVVPERQGTGLPQQAATLAKGSGSRFLRFDCVSDGRSCGHFTRALASGTIAIGSSAA